MKINNKFLYIMLFFKSAGYLSLVAMQDKPMYPSYFKVAVAKKMVREDVLTLQKYQNQLNDIKSKDKFPNVEELQSQINTCESKLEGLKQAIKNAEYRLPKTYFVMNFATLHAFADTVIDKRPVFFSGLTTLYAYLPKAR